MILYAFLSMTALSAYPVHQLGNQWVTDLTQRFLDDPIMGIAYAMPEEIRGILSFWVGLLAVTILVIATNAGVLGASRLAYFMEHGSNFRRLSLINRRSRVPLRAILVFSILGALL